MRGLQPPRKSLNDKTVKNFKWIWQNLMRLKENYFDWAWNLFFAAKPQKQNLSRKYGGASFEGKYGGKKCGAYGGSRFVTRDSRKIWAENCEKSSIKVRLELYPRVGARLVGA